MSFKDFNPNKDILKPNERVECKITQSIERNPEVKIEHSRTRLEGRPKVKIESSKTRLEGKLRVKIEHSKIKPPENKHRQVIKHSPKKRYRTEPKNINIDKYVKLVVDKWYNSAKKQKKQLQLSMGRNYLSIKDKNFTSVYKNRGNNNYAGTVYRIIEKGTGKMRYRVTQGTLEGRWSRYKHDAKREINNPKIIPFHKKILESLEIGKNPDSSFIMRPVEVCLDINTLALREDFWIKKHNTQHPLKGYNIKGGGVGIKLDVPMHSIASSIARGLSVTEICKRLSDSGLKLSRRTISRRINQYWGGKVEARKKFLKPVLEGIIKEGYKTNDITHSFKIYGRNIVDRIIPQLFENKSFTELRRTYLTKRLEPLIIKGLGPKAMDTQLTFHGLVEINNTIKEEWGSLDSAQKKLWKPIILSRLKSGEHPTNILTDFGYSVTSAKSQYNRVLKRLFNGMTYSQLKDEIN